MDERAIHNPNPRNMAGNEGHDDRDPPPVSGVNGEQSPRQRARRFRGLGRRVNALTSANWFDQIPSDVQALVLSNLTEFAPWAEAEELGLVFGEPVCGGLAAECEEHSATNAAVDVIHSLPGPVYEVVTYPFRTGDFARPFEDAAFDRAALSLEQRVVDRVTVAEHSLHQYGVVMSARQGRALAKYTLAKYLLMLSIIYQVPLVEAASTAAGGSWDHWLRDLVGWAQRLALLCYTRLYDFTGEWSTWTVCQHVIEYASVEDIKNACYAGEINEFTCERFAYDWQNPYFHKNALRVFKVPRLECGLRLFPNIHFFLLHACLSVVAGLALILALALLERAFPLALQLAGFVFSLPLKLIRSVRGLYSRLHELIVHLKVVRLLSGAEVSSTEKDLRSIGNNWLRWGAPVHCDVLEMAIQGSGIRPSNAVPGCIYLTNVCGEEVSLIGMGFRHRDYLVTAGHNRLALNSIPGKTYAVPFRPTSMDTMELAMSSALEITDEMWDNDISGALGDAYDACVVPLAPSAWSKLAVKALDFADAAWDHNVTVYGLEKSGRHTLQRTMGRIVKKEDTPLHQVFYTATTLKGWSGAPVLSGQRKVVAVHCGNNGELNRGLNFAYIRFIIARHERKTLEISPDAWAKLLRECFRFKGRLALRNEEIYDDYDDYSDASSDYYPEERYLSFQDDRGVVGFGSKRDFDDYEEYDRHREQRYDIRYGDECNVPLKVQTHNTQLPPNITTVVDKPVTPKTTRLPQFQTDSHYTSRRTDDTVSSPYVKVVDGIQDDTLRLEEAVALGYTPGEFAMPAATDRAEAVKLSKESLVNSLKEAEVARSNAKPLDDDILSATKILLLKSLTYLKYMPNPDGVSVDTIKSQLYSSAVGDSKCPGSPFVQQGFVNNASLLAHTPPQDFATDAYQRYVDDNYDQPSINVLKIEPTKVAKLAEGKARCVQMVSLWYQLYFRCLIGRLGDVAATSYRKGSVMAGFSPLKPGDGEHLYTSLAVKGWKIFGFDFKGFEFFAHTPEVYELVSDVIVALAVRPKEWDEERFETWKKEVRAFMTKTGKMGFLFGDGVVIDKKIAFGMSSGRWDTFLRNSITSIFWTYYALLSLGLTADQVLNQVKVYAGGDDVIGRVKSSLKFEVSDLVAVLGEHGVPVHKEYSQEHDEPFEFFSWKFYKNNLGMVSWVPTRFTKHVENLRRTSLKNRPQALVSHMANWVHDKEKFEYFRELYLEALGRGELGYELRFVPDRQELIQHMRGQEAFVKEPIKVADALVTASLWRSYESSLHSSWRA